MLRNLIENGLLGEAKTAASDVARSSPQRRTENSGKVFVAIGLALEIAAEFLGSEDDSSQARKDDYVGEPWGTHGHNGPFGHWTDN
jgi:hypothetical protein